LNSAQEWLSYDLVRFKIELKVEVKFICKKRNKTNTAAVALPASGHQAAMF